MKLNRKLWTAALAVAMTTPSAMAAQDTAGMHYTSAAEGFYASIRVRYDANGNKEDGGSNIGNSGSRFGIRGTNDLGGGMEGFYQYEMGVSTEDGDGGMSTRVGHVGLRGDFGAVVGGSFWTDSYSWVYGSTDVANVASGNFAYTSGRFGQGRSKKSIQYTTPDLNGFQGAILIQADASKDGKHGGVPGDRTEVVPSVTLRMAVTTATSTVTMVTSEEGKRNGNPKDDTDIDHWNIAAKYDIAGFSTGFSFSRFPDADGEGKDLDSWAAKLGYSQDNWYVNSWYGEVGTASNLECRPASVPENNDEGIGYKKCQDTSVFSIAGGITVDKVGVYAVHETSQNASEEDDSYSTLGIQYNLGSRSRIWVEYAAQDLDSGPDYYSGKLDADVRDEDDTFTIGLRHDF